MCIATIITKSMQQSPAVSRPFGNCSLVTVTSRAVKDFSWHAPNSSCSQKRRHFLLILKFHVSKGRYVSMHGKVRGNRFIFFWIRNNLGRSDDTEFKQVLKNPEPYIAILFNCLTTIFSFFFFFKPEYSPLGLSASYWMLARGPSQEAVLYQATTICPQLAYILLRVWRSLHHFLLLCHCLQNSSHNDLMSLPYISSWVTRILAVTIPWPEKNLCLNLMNGSFLIFRSTWVSTP